MRHSTRKLTQKSKSTKVLLGLILSLAAVLSLTLSVLSNSDKAFAAELTAELTAEPISIAEVTDEPVTDEAPKNLADLQQASDAQLDNWAKKLSSFDGRNYDIVTPAKYQKHNICWAYATVGAAETNILRSGIDKSAKITNLDFDERLLAYARFNRDGLHDPLQLTAGDVAISGMWDTGDVGYNAYDTMTEGYGLVEQNDSLDLNDLDAMNSELIQSEYYVKNYFTVSREIEDMKRAILQYGALSFSYYAPSYQDKYYSGQSLTNHESLIVGWDDNIDTSGFKPLTPKNKGAWIVKNSWGNYGNDINGVYCFYMSYEEHIVAPYAVEVTMRDDYQNIYHYDGQISPSRASIEAQKQAAIFEAKLSSSTKQEQLNAITVYTDLDNIDVNIEIYKNLTVNPGDVNDRINDPENGELATSQTSHLDVNGFHTIDLNSPVDLEQGEYFSIVISSESAPKGVAICTSDKASVNDMTYYFDGDKWESYKQSDNYADSSNFSYAARIRAITNVVDRGKDLGNDLRYARVEIPDRLVFYEKGQDAVPSVEVYFDEELLEAGVDYDTQIIDNETVGTATLKILGKGEFFGTRTTSFEVAKSKYPPGRISGTVIVYNDKINLHDIPIPAGWRWIDQDRVLTLGRSQYQVSLLYEGDDKDLYQNLYSSFYVDKKDEEPPTQTDISLAALEISGTYTYTGEQIEPKVKVTYLGKELQNGTDYRLTVQNAVNAGYATVKVEGIGDFYGETSQTFQIRKARWPLNRPKSTIIVGEDITSSSEIALGTNWSWQKSFTITGGKTQAVAVYNGSDKKNFANTKLRVTIADGSKETRKSISSVSLSLSEDTFVYDGQAKQPNVVAKDGTTTLQEGRDFSVQYSDNIGAGQGRVIVKGQNDYMGSKTLTFTIERAERTDFSVTQKGWTYGDKDVSKPSVSGEIETGTVTFTYSTDENGTYSSDVPTHAGSYWVKAEINETQNYNSATAKAQFVISPKDAEGLNASLENDTFVYDTTAKTPKVVIKDGSVRLVAGEDYDVEYENNKFAGEGNAIVTFKNNYKGTKELTFTIEKAEKPNVDTTIECDKEATTLSDVALPEGFVWVDDSIEITGDKMTAKAVYVGADASCYKNTELTFEITVVSQSTPSTPGQDSPSVPGDETPGDIPGGTTPGENPSDPSENTGDSGENDDGKNGCASCGTVTFGGTGGIGGGLGGGIAGGLAFLLASIILIFPLKKRPER